MKLRNPGPVRPAPALSGPTGVLAERVSGWPDVVGYTHWRLGSPGVVDGAEFHLGDPELGHIHLDGSAHVPLTRPLASLVVESGLGRTPRWSDSWIICPVRSQADVDGAAWLFGLAYACVQGASDEEVAELIADRALKPSQARTGA